MDIDTLNALVRGIGVGSTYSLVALGYAAIYAGTKIVNFAQGDYIVLGAYFTVLFQVSLGLPLGVAAGLMVLSVIAVALVEEVVAARPVLRRAKTNLWILSTLGFSIVLTQSMHYFGGASSRPVPALVPNRLLSLGPLQVPWSYATVFVMAVSIALLLGVFYRRSRWGRALFAASQAREAAALRGVRPSTVSFASFGLSGLIMGAGAFVVGPIIFADYTVGLTYGLKGFIAASLGGMGSVKGALVGGWVLGALEGVTVLYLGVTFQNIFALALFLIVLMVRPNGLFGAVNLREV